MLTLLNVFIISGVMRNTTPNFKQLLSQLLLQCGKANNKSVKDFGVSFTLV